MKNGTEILGKLLGTEAKVKIMRLFLLNSAQAFDLKDITQRTKLSPSAVRRELNMLTAIDFIKKKTFVKETLLARKGKNAKQVYSRKKVIGWSLVPTFMYMDQVKGLLTEADFFDHEALALRFKKAGKIKLLVVSGIFIKSSGETRADLLIIGDNLKRKIIEDAIKKIEAEIGKELSYAVFTTPEFLYRAEMYDKLVCDMLEFPHETLIDTAKLSTMVARKF